MEKAIREFAPILWPFVSRAGIHESFKQTHHVLVVVQHPLRVPLHGHNPIAGFAFQSLDHIIGRAGAHTEAGPDLLHCLVVRAVDLEIVIQDCRQQAVRFQMHGMR